MGGWWYATIPAGLLLLVAERGLLGLGLAVAFILVLLTCLPRGPGQD